MAWCIAKCHHAWSPQPTPPHKRSQSVWFTTNTNTTTQQPQPWSPHSTTTMVSSSCLVCVSQMASDWLHGHTLATSNNTPPMPHPLREREVWMEQERQWMGEGVVIEWKWLAKTSESQAPQQTPLIQQSPSHPCKATSVLHHNQVPFISHTHTHQVAASKKTGVAQGQRATTK